MYAGNQCRDYSSPVYGMRSDVAFPSTLAYGKYMLMTHLVSPINPPLGRSLFAEMTKSDQAKFHFITVSYHRQTREQIGTERVTPLLEGI
ncbi:hypothetical protein EVAR_101515_1 [Eumeta japonica]|uniref:Uncharacterized protein n=1 Tax=Eumeta variegata TaxID=151549 RepID=A0A4C1TCE1_EUMVA|nr:hypothetical protein EVAR_101515_1 [Eumeta japonica]